LRAIKSALLLAKTEKGAAEELTEEAEIKVLQKLIKQRKESADIYKTQNRDDLYQIEMEEMAVIEPYLPQQMTRFEIEGLSTRADWPHRCNIGKRYGPGNGHGQ
jgi:uncharacterized protein YqeY